MTAATTPATERPERVQAAFMVFHERDYTGPNASALFDYIVQLEDRIHSEREQAIRECAEIARNVSYDGRYNGEASVDTSHSIYQQGAFEVYEMLLSVIEGSAALCSGWQPIETAPRDGTRVLLWRHGFLVMIGAWLENTRTYMEPTWLSNNAPIISPPTHWQFLPTPPALSQEERT